MGRSPAKILQGKCALQPFPRVQSAYLAFEKNQVVKQKFEKIFVKWFSQKCIARFFEKTDILSMLQ